MKANYPIPNSTYGLQTDWSYQNELFWYISLSWRCSVRILKIRSAPWKPNAILDTYRDYDFKAIENLFEDLWKRDNFDNKGHFNTGERIKWFRDIFLPLARAKFKPLVPWE